MRDLMEWTTPYLSEKRIENSRLNVEWLLCHTLQCKRVDLYADHDRPLNKNELEDFKAALKRRVDHEPLQYITGSAEFMGLTFEVGPDVLIPRPDTEVLVEKTLEVCRGDVFRERPIYILDIGTGSGAIAVSLAFFLKKNSIPCEITALDVSSKAIQVAQRNAERILPPGSVNFLCGNILDESIGNAFVHPFDVIVSNPPYISDKEFNELPEEIKNFEPHEALKAEEEGLIFFRHISKTAIKLFRQNGKENFLLFEVGYDQAQEVRKIMLENSFSDIEIVDDYHHVERVVKGILN